MTLDAEKQIVNRVLAGDRDAYAALIDAYKGPVFNIAFRMTGSYQDADDLTQETFIRAYRNLRQFQTDRKFFTWLYTIGLNLIRGHLKKKRVETSPGIMDLMVTAAAIRDDAQMERDLILSQDIGRLEICLLKLPVDLRESVVLRFYQELSFEEIAVLSDASVSAVKMRVYRGLEKLRVLMSPSLP